MVAASSFSSNNLAFFTEVVMFCLGKIRHERWEFLNKQLLACPSLKLHLDTLS